MAQSPHSPETNQLHTIEDGSQETIINADDPEFVYVPVCSTLVGHVYKRVHRDQALALLANNSTCDQPKTGALNSDDFLTRLLFRYANNDQFTGASVLVLCMYVLLGFTLLEALLHLTQLGNIGLLVQLYLPIAYPSYILVDTLLTVIVTVRLYIFFASKTNTSSTIHPMTPDTGAIVIPRLVRPSPNGNKPLHVLTTCIYLVSLIASACTFPFADELNLASSRQTLLLDYVQSSTIKQDVPDGYILPRQVWSVAILIRSGSILLACILEQSFG